MQPVPELACEWRDIDRPEHAAESGFGRARVPAVRQTPTAQPPPHRKAEPLPPCADRGTALCATDHRVAEGRHERTLRMTLTARPTGVIELLQPGKQCGRIRFGQRHGFHLLVG